jgi:hypothetical protein
MGCLVALIGSLVVFLWDINQALLALRLEIGDVLGEGESSSKSRRKRAGG